MSAPIEQLRRMQEHIVQKMDRIGQLNAYFKNKQEKQFLKTFVQIMDRLSGELVEVEQQFQSIDEEIEKDEKCVKLAKQLKFFSDQCLELRRELQDKQQQIQQQRAKNQELLKEREELTQSLIKQSKQINKYRIRAEYLSKTLSVDRRSDLPASERASPNKFRNTTHGFLFKKSEAIPETERKTNIFQSIQPRPLPSWRNKRKSANTSVLTSEFGNQLNM